MAIAKKMKTKTRSQAKSFDQKHYGDEPIYKGTPTNSQFADAFNWYNYMYDVSKGKQWLLEYLKKDSRSPQMIREIRNAPDWRTSGTQCWIARMMLNGTTIPDTMMERFNERLTENALYGIKHEAPKTNSNVVSIQDRTKRVINNLISDAEEQLDLNPEFGMYDFLTKKLATAQGAAAVRAFYLPMMEETLLDDEQVKESYGKKLKFWQKVFSGIISDCDRYLNNKKAVKVRKPRAIKLKTSADVVKNVKYQVGDAALKLASVDPQKVVGATQLWVYNTKYRTLGVYNSNAPKGFSFKGTTLTGFDPDLSVSKKLRKPEEQLQSFFQQGKVALRGFLPAIKTADTKLNGRINGDTILLKVV